MRKENVAWLLLVFLLILGTLSPGPTEAQVAFDCNPCHYCPDRDDEVFIGDWGVSTHAIESPPNFDCQPWCNDFGPTCNGEQLTAMAGLAEAVSSGEMPALTELGPEQRQRLRFIPDRNLAVVLSTCDDGWLAVFPVRPEEVEFANHHVKHLESD